LKKVDTTSQIILLIYISAKEISELTFGFV